MNMKTKLFLKLNHSIRKQKLKNVLEIKNKDGFLELEFNEIPTAFGLEILM